MELAEPAGTLGEDGRETGPVARFLNAVLAGRSVDRVVTVVAGYAVWAALVAELGDELTPELHEVRVGPTVVHRMPFAPEELADAILVTTWVDGRDGKPVAETTDTYCAAAWDPAVPDEVACVYSTLRSDGMDVQAALDAAWLLDTSAL